MPTANVIARSMETVPTQSSLLTLGAAVLFACTPGSGSAARGPHDAPATPATIARPGIDLVSGERLYSQGKEELIIRDFLRDRRGGVFLDVGCASPIANSNTYYLEKHLGWSGIGVDALPDFAAAWKKKRPNSRYLNFMISDHEEASTPFYRAALRGISSSERDIKGPAGDAVKTEEIHVPMTTLTRLLDAAGVAHVDFLSLDIEGGEPPALAGFDIDRFKPQLACIESKPDNREKILKYFDDHGYRRLERYLEYDKTNYYFAPKTGR